MKKLIKLLKSINIDVDDSDKIAQLLELVERERGVYDREHLFNKLLSVAGKDILIPMLTTFLVLFFNGGDIKTDWNNFIMLGILCFIVCVEISLIVSLIRVLIYPRRRYLDQLIRDLNDLRMFDKGTSIILSEI